MRGRSRKDGRHVERNVVVGNRCKVLEFRTLASEKKSGNINRYGCIFCPKDDAMGNDTACCGLYADKKERERFLRGLGF